MQTRRVFLRNCSNLTAAVVFASGIAISEGVSFSARPDFECDLSCATFLRTLHSHFEITPLAGSSPLGRLELIEVTNGISRTSKDAEDASNEKFAILFRGDSSVRLGQNTYRFDHPLVGRFAMFIVPVGASSGAHHYYEAVFNRVPTGLAATS